MKFYNFILIFAFLSLSTVSAEQPQQKQTVHTLKTRAKQAAQYTCYVVAIVGIELLVCLCFEAAGFPTTGMVGVGYYPLINSFE